MKEVREIHAYVSIPTYEWLRKKSFEERRSMAEIIRQILEEEQKKV